MCWLKLSVATGLIACATVCHPWDIKHLALNGDDACSQEDATKLMNRLGNFDAPADRSAMVALLYEGIVNFAWSEPEVVLLAPMSNQGSMYTASDFIQALALAASALPNATTNHWCLIPHMHIKNAGPNK